MTGTNVVPFEGNNLTTRAKRIRELMNDMVHNMLAVGKELAQARDEFPTRPNGVPMGWKKWVKQEFNLTTVWAASLIRVYKKFGDSVGDTPIPSLKVLTFLARPTTPEEARKEVLGRVAKGEIIGAGKTQEIIKKHLPSPKQAIEKAQQTGKFIAASDGYLYGGASQEELAQATFKRTLTFAVIDAVATLATIKWNAAQFLDQVAQPHQLWKGRSDEQIGHAIEWLRELDREWSKRKAK